MAPSVPARVISHLTDSQEDWNLNGRWHAFTTNETNPASWGTDLDGLSDGNCSGKGEDLNLNGWRDQDAGGNWTETDALANDSDVDGVLDGLEVNGSYCFSTESGCTPGAVSNATREIDPLDPDTDGDQLRDGQEVALNPRAGRPWDEGTGFKSRGVHINSAR